MARKRRGNRLKSEMNVVPYIDVMLVLLVIFMISAPLLNQSVEVSLPQSHSAHDLPPHDETITQPLVISIDKQGLYYIDRADDNSLPVSINLIRQITQETLKDNPQTPVYIRGDKAVYYESVMTMMDVLKSSGANSVGLITAAEEE